MKPLISYQSLQRFSLTGLFTVFSVNFSGPFRVTKVRNRFMLFGVEHLTGWPILLDTTSFTGVMVLENFTMKVI